MKHGKKRGNPRQGGGFSFVDRSGKVHGAPGRSGASGRAPEKSPEKPHAKPQGKSPIRPLSKPKHAAPAPGAGKGGRDKGRPEKFHGKPQGKSQGKTHGKGRDQDRDKDRGGFRGKFQGKNRSKHSGGRGNQPGLTLKATVDKNHKGFAFLIPEEKGRGQDFFVPPREAATLFHGDRVEVSVGGRGEIRSLRVLEHRFREMVGRYSPHPMSGRGGWVVYERKRAREEVFAPKCPPNAKTGDWVRAKLHFHDGGPHPVTAEILEVYGAELPPSADVGMVAAEYNLLEEHSSAAVKQAESLRLEVPGKDLQGRADLRSVPFITIDGETARDFDDAVYVERLKSGFILWVAIADVSHYVTRGSALDVEAESRGTSVYFPERAFHMLPRALSENLCSLRPNEPRLAMVAKMEYDRQGKRHHTEVLEAVIQSKRRATYNQIQEEWDRNRKNKDWEYEPHFALYELIKKSRLDRGSIDFDLPEAEVNVAPTGEVISIRQRGRLDAHRLIEEFMIGANEAVTEWMMEREWPFVYRIHEEPAAEALQRFQELAATVGVRVSLERTVSPKVLADVVKRLEGHSAQALLNTALLRSMKRAVYSSSHGIHYGLASQGYTHFTSPIRRYPDLVVHRLLRWALNVEERRKPALKPAEKQDLEKDLADTCEHCSYRERLATEAERESIKLKQVRVMTTKLGQEFDATVIGMVENGLFAELKEPYVEGFVSRESMMDDFYQFDEERMVFVGRRKRRIIKVGDRFRIRVLKADLDKRQIDFGMVQTPAPAGQKESSRQI